MTLSQLTIRDFQNRAASGLLSAPPLSTEKPHTSPSDFDLDPAARLELAEPTRTRPAAVLVPIVRRPQPTILLTLRPQHMTEHRGQISFPGGKVDDGDANIRATALREASEEIGLSKSQAEIIGYLDAYQTVTGYWISPVVALITPSFRAQANPDEVEDVFEVPLAFLMSAKNYRVDTTTYKGKVRKFYAIPYRDRYIWGATAGILRNLYMRLFEQ